MTRISLILVLLGLFLGPGSAVAESPAVSAAICPAVTAPLDPLEFQRPTPKVERCSASVECPDSSVISCMGWECGVFVDGTGVQCGIYCLLNVSGRYCPGYNSSNCN
jgi:hypothetical protein